MTQEEKLRQLLQVAVENGWKPTCKLQEYILEDYQSFEIEDCTVHNHQSYEDYKWFSLDQLVGQWEHNEVSFIGALCKTADSYLLDQAMELNNDLPMYESGDDFEYFHDEETIRMIWSNTPSSKRLEELFRIFDHLLS